MIERPNTGWPARPDHRKRWLETTALGMVAASLFGISLVLLILLGNERFEGLDLAVGILSFVSFLASLGLGLMAFATWKMSPGAEIIIRHLLEDNVVDQLRTDLALEVARKVGGLERSLERSLEDRHNTNSAYLTGINRTLSTVLKELGTHDSRIAMLLGEGPKDGGPSVNVEPEVEDEPKTTIPGGRPEGLRPAPPRAGPRGT